MEKVTVYGWCHSWQCVADWSWGQNANNLFTLMGAIATFVAAFLALRFSHQEARRKQSDDMLRARLVAIANVHLVSDVHAFLHNSITRIEAAAAASEGHDAAKHALRISLAVMDTSLETVADDALVFLVPLGANGAFRITRAYATLAHLNEQRQPLRLLFDEIAPNEKLNDTHRAAAKIVVAELASARADLAIASAVLEHAAKF